jgi:hypothetical protein
MRDEMKMFGNKIYNGAGSLLIDDGKAIMITH